MSNLSRVDLSVIELWTAKDMTFVIEGRRIGVIPKFTKCKKVRYTHKIKYTLEKMEERGFNRPSENTKAVCVELSGKLRYVWRTDVLTESEYDIERKRGTTSLKRVLSEKRKGSVDEG